MKDQNGNSIVRPKARLKRPDNAEQIYKGKVFQLFNWQQQLFDGTFARFDGLKRPDTVLILPVMDDGTIMFADETQPGMGAMLRSLGGKIEDGESPVSAAERELAEETGYSAEEFRLWDAWQPVNKIDWAVYLFVAHGLKKSSGTNLDAGEKINVTFFNVSDVITRNSSLVFDDYELNYKIFEALASDKEESRIKKLLTR